MTNNRGQEVFTLEGTVLRKYPAEQGVAKGRTYVKNKFILKTLDGRDIYVTKFGEFSAEFIGKDVRFQATKYNETNYTVQGELEDAGDLVGAIAPTAQVATTSAGTPTPARRRGRPTRTAVPAVTPSNVPTTKSQSVDTVVDDSRESLRVQAEHSTLLDLQSAIRLAKELGLDTKDTQGIVALADRVGRTITAIGMDNRNKR